MPTKRIALCTAVAALVVSCAADAHHSYAEYDDSKTLEIEGKLLVVAWQNPHTHLEVQALDSDGRPKVWSIESGPVNSLRRREVPLDVAHVGDVVKVAGWASKRADDRLYATNLLAGGSEVLLQGTAPHWVAAVVYGGAPAAPAKAAAEPNAPTFFRVWSSDQNDPEARTGFLSRAQFSLTDAAKKSVAGFDRVAQSTAVGCTPKAMPILMGQPLPIELEDRGTTIVLKLEEYDAVRTIHMTAETAAAATGRSPLGYSAGHWDDGVLVVETDRIDAPYFNSSGVPLGPSAKTIERFWLSDEGRRLSYELVVIDADTFTAPARAKRAWLGRDGERLLPYDCRASPR